MANSNFSHGSSLLLTGEGIEALARATSETGNLIGVVVGVSNLDLNVNFSFV